MSNFCTKYYSEYGEHLWTSTKLPRYRLFRPKSKDNHTEYIHLTTGGGIMATDYFVKFCKISGKIVHIKNNGRYSPLRKRIYKRRR